MFKCIVILGLIVFSSCKSDPPVFTIFKGLKIPCTSAESDKQVDSLRKLNLLVRAKFTNGDYIVAIKEYINNKEVYFTGYASTQANVATEYKFYLMDRPTFEYGAQKIIPVGATYDDIFPYTPTTESRPVNDNMVNSLINQLDSKYSTHTIDTASIHDAQFSEDMDHTIYSWKYEGLNVELRVIKIRGSNLIKVILDYTLSEEYKLKYKEFLNTLKSKSSKF